MAMGYAIPPGGFWAFLWLGIREYAKWCWPPYAIRQWRAAQEETERLLAELKRDTTALSEQMREQRERLEAARPERKR